MNKTEVATENRHFSYPADLAFFETAGKFKKKEINFSGQTVVAGIIPHHLLAADLIAEFFHNLAGQTYDTVILIGPNHFQRGNAALITSAYDWQTPYGVLACDQELRKNLEAAGVKAEEEVIASEHAVTAEVGFIKQAFPQAQFLPIILQPTVKADQAEALAQALSASSQDKKILVLASVDFSHYQDNLTAQQADKLSIAALRSLALDQIYSLALDSPASIYTVTRFSQLQAAGFELLNNSNSALLADKPDLESTTSYVTGYFVPGYSESGDSQSDRTSLRFLFLGDLMLDRYVADEIAQKGFDHLLVKWQEENFLADYDMISANLEGTVTNGGEHYPPVKNFDFAFDPAVVGQLKAYGFNFFSLANNHFSDQGNQGIDETRANLTQLGFDYAGCANGEVAECSSKIINIRGKKIALAAFSIFGSGLEAKKAEETILNLRTQADLVLVNIHWGYEYAEQFSPSQQVLARSLIDAGADLIVGHHPHVAQGIEVYQNRLIFYSLGNFIFDQYFSAEAQKGLALEVLADSDDFRFRLHPFRGRKSQVSLLDGEEKTDFLQMIADRSPDLAAEWVESITKGEGEISID